MTKTHPEPTKASAITLREITEDTVRVVCGLDVRPDQARFVTPNSLSIAEAHFSKHAWFRMVCADETPVGFVMLEDQPDKSEYYLWRFMIDARYQRLGFGRRALGLLIEHVKTRPHATELLTSVAQAAGGPQPFYEGLGFVATGEYEHGEAMMRLPL